MTKVTYLVFVFVVVGLIYLFSGSYNVSAIKPHFSFVESFLHVFKENSIKKHSKNVIVPKLDNQNFIKRGFKNYDEMCTGCHGVPGEPESVVQQGLYPKPPELNEMQEEYGTKELFWIIKNGVKLSGMPSYGVTHSEDDIWSIVAFMKKFEDISKNDYKIMKKSVINMDYNHIHKDGKVHKH